MTLGLQGHGNMRTITYSDALIRNVSNCSIRCMSRFTEAKQVLRNAGRELRRLAGCALEEGAFADVAEIARLAEKLATAVPDEGHSPKRKSSSVATSNSKTTKKPRARKPSKKSYPRFVRDGDKLLKIGWSKKSNSEYKHRTPLSVPTRLLVAIREKVPEGKLFAATDVIPLMREEGESVPDYQAYLALKWLHTEGVVTKHGRDRYAIELGTVDDQTLEQLWQRLPRFTGASR